MSKRDLPFIEKIPRGTRRRNMHASLRTGFVELGSDVLPRIFSRLPTKTLVFCSMVCTLWNDVVKKNPSLWKSSYFVDQTVLLPPSAATRAAETSSTMNDLGWRDLAIDEEHSSRLVLRESSMYSWRAHSDRVNCCRIAMEQVLTGSSDETVRVWCANSYRCLETYRVPNKAPVVDVHFDEMKVFAAARQHVFIWSRQDDRRLLCQMGGHNQFYSMCVSDPEVAVGCADGCVRVYDLYSRRCSRMIRQHQGPVRSVAMDVTGTLLASGSSDGTVAVCEAQSGLHVGHLKNRKVASGVKCLHMNSSDNKLFVGGMSGFILCYDLRKMENWKSEIDSGDATIWHNQASTNTVSCLQRRTDFISSVIVASGLDGYLRVLNANTGKMLAHHKSTVKSPILGLALGFSKVVTSHADFTVGFWRF